jgi:hypothetical protein
MLHLRSITRRHLITFLLVICNLFRLPAQSPVTQEYQIKAVFLFNFAQFVEWPSTAFASDQDPLIIGVLGENPFGSYLENVVSGEKIKGHSLVVHYYKNSDDVKNCHILFINKNSINNVNAFLSNLREKNILTVSDASNFIQQGGIVRFISKNNKINFQINPDAAKSAKLEISSKLLRLAEIFVP